MRKKEKNLLDAKLPPIGLLISLFCPLRICSSLITRLGYGNTQLNEPIVNSAALVSFNWSKNSGWFSKPINERSRPCWPLTPLSELSRISNVHNGFWTGVISW